MKKTFALILVGIMIFSLGACGQNTSGSDTSDNTDSGIVVDIDESTEANQNTDSAETILCGGWSKAADPTVTDDIKSLVQKATETLIGAKYTPVAYIGSQVVAGTNHLILCKVEATTPEATATYKLITVYQDLEGNAEVTEILDSTAEAGTPGLDGGWNSPETPVVTDETKAVLEKATEKMVGAEYTPLALLATQVVAGTNYSILCEVTAVTPSAEPKYVIVHVYEDLEGSAEITDTFEFASVAE